jgi:hypothetical protein
VTNTLHRYGDAESFRDDYVVFAIASKGINDADALPKLRRFLQLAIAFHPVNLGDSRHGGALRPCRHLNPLVHWSRERELDFEAVVRELDHPCTCAAVFDDRQAAQEFVERVKAEDLGLSVNISTSVDGAEQCCYEAALKRHSVGYSLGFEGKTELLPNSQVLMLSTMCGHGMIGNSLAKKMIDWVKEGRRTPEEAASYLTRFCSCGVFNPSRAKRILEDARTKSR